MATIAFPKINALLEGQNPRPQDQLLAPQGNQPANVQATPQQGQPAGSAQIQTSGASTEVGGGAMGSQNKALQGQTAGQYTQSKFPKIMALIDKNVHKQADVNLAGGVQQQAQQGTQQLQADANRYAVTQQQALQPTAKPGDVAAAEQGGEALERVRTDANRTIARPEDFKFDGQQSFDSLNAFTSRDGATTALQKQNAGQNYSQGSARLDSLLLGTNQGYVDQANRSQEAVGGFRDKVASTQTDFNKAGGLLDQQVTGAQAQQSDLRSKLGERAKAITSDRQSANSQQDIQNKAMRDLYAKSRAKLEAEFKAKYGAGGNGRFDNSNPYLQENLKMINTALNDKSVMGAYDAGSDAGQFMSADEAARFNNLQSVLGGGQVTAQGAQGRAATFDQNAYGERGRAALDALVQKLLTPPTRTQDSTIGAGSTGKVKAPAAPSAKKEAKSAAAPIIERAKETAKVMLDPRETAKKLDPRKW